MFDWKGILRSLFGPKQHIKRRCLIDGLPMDVDSTGVFRCPQGHTLDPNRKSGVNDEAMKAGEGHKSGEI